MIVLVMVLGVFVVGSSSVGMKVRCIQLFLPNFKHYHIDNDNNDKDNEKGDDVIVVAINYLLTENGVLFYSICV